MAGLDYVFKVKGERQDSGFRPYEGVHEKVRGLMRSWLAREMVARVDFVPA
jgi:hypothetical protein